MHQGERPILVDSAATYACILEHVHQGHHVIDSSCIAPFKYGKQ